MALETRTVNLPGAGAVVCAVSLTKNASGATMFRVLKDARRVDDQRLSEGDRKTAARLADAIA